MKTTVTESTFIRDFIAIRPDQFSVPALRALFEYYSEAEESTGEEMEFDPIAICCDWCEFGTAIEGAMEYGFKPDTCGDADTEENAALEWLRDNTQIIEIEGGSVVVLGF
jgi:hypothetical protein